MSTQAKTGHAVNVDHLQDIISKATGYGTFYNPANSKITLTALIAIHALAEASNDTAIRLLKENRAAIAARHAVFTPSKPLSTRILRAVKSLDLDDSVVTQTKSLVSKVKGVRITPISKSNNTKVNTDETVPAKVIKKHSASHQAFVNIIEHYTGIIVLLKDQVNYTPNETEFTINALTALVADMKLKNTACIDAETNYINGLIARNKVLYTPKTGLCDLALQVKTYVSSVYGTKSPEFKEIKSIKFRKLRK